MENLKCVITNQSLARSIPEFDFKLMFENDFFEDEYIFESEKKIPSINQIKYNIKKNNESIGSIIMENYDFDVFMANFLNIIDDFDVQKLYQKNIHTQLFENYNRFIDSFEIDIKKRPNNLIGEVYKMRRVAGLI